MLSGPGDPDGADRAGAHETSGRAGPAGVAKPGSGRWQQRSLVFCSALRCGSVRLLYAESENKGAHGFDRATAIGATIEGKAAMPAHLTTLTRAAVEEVYRTGQTAKWN